jgi:hypothetical protein
VANAHAWGSRCLIFSDGAVALSALSIGVGYVGYGIGIASYCSM